MINRPVAFPDLMAKLKLLFDDETIHLRLNLLYTGAKLTGYAYDEILRCGFFAALPLNTTDLVFVPFYTDPADDGIIPTEEPVQ